LFTGNQCLKKAHPALAGPSEINPPADLRGYPALISANW